MLKGYEKSPRTVDPQLEHFNTFRAVTQGPGKKNQLEKMSHMPTYIRIYTPIGEDLRDNVWFDSFQALHIPFSMGEFSLESSKLS